VPTRTDRSNRNLLLHAVNGFDRDHVGAIKHKSAPLVSRSGRNQKNVSGECTRRANRRKIIVLADCSENHDFNARKTVRQPTAVPKIPTSGGRPLITAL
jgi:hypothetical protein